MLKPHLLIVPIAALLGLATSAWANVTANDDHVSLCDGAAVVDALANDHNNSGRNFDVSLDQNNCPGAITQVDSGVFDVTFALGATSSCTFQYSADDGQLADSAIVTLELQAGCEGALDVPTLLSVHPENPRYLVNTAGETVLLSGGHVWQNMQDYGPLNPNPPTNCGDHECGAEEWDYLANTLGHNFTRGWHWEQGQIFGYAQDWENTPVPYQYDGTHYDLNTFNQTYFDRLKDRVQAASNAGLYISVMLFEGFSPRGSNNSANSWDGHPFNPDKTNSLGGYDPDAFANGGDNDGGGEEIHSLANATITAYQYAYIDKLVAELNAFDNIIWEICNECGDSDGTPTWGETLAWMNDMAARIRNQESMAGRKQHLIWISSPYGNNTDQNEDLANSTADIVSYRGTNSCGSNMPCFHTDPPMNRTVAQPANTNPTDFTPHLVLLDSDHIYNPYCVDFAGKSGWCSAQWPWKTFLRGYNPVFMDTTRTLTPFDGTNPNHPLFPNGVPQDDDSVERTRLALGQVQQIANELVADLGAMIPSTTIASTGYALANEEDGEYLVYQPNSGDFTLDVIAGVYDITWFEVGANNGSGQLHPTITNQALDGGVETFGESGPGWVLHLVRTEPASDLAVTDPADVSTAVGTPASFSITASAGTPPYAYQWQGSVAGPFSFVDLVPTTGVSGINSPTLHIDPVTLGHDGYYRCAVTDATGHTVYSGAAELVVTESALTANPDTFTFTELAAYYVINPDDMIANDDPNSGVWIDFVNGLRDPSPSGHFNIVGGNIRYIPELGFPGGSVTFEYQTTDGEDNSNWATVTLHIPSPPGTLVANPDTITYSTIRSSYNIRDNADLLANDNPSVGVVIDFNNGVIPPPASQGTLTRDVGSPIATMVFTPVANFPGGEVTFEYQTTDGIDSSNWATVTLHIPGQPVTLVANPDTVTYSTFRSSYYVHDNAHLLANDEPSDGVVIDFNNGVTHPPASQGTLTRDVGSPIATMVFTPVAGFPGGDVSFSYQMTNGTDVSNFATVTLTIPAPPGPVANDDNATTAYATAVEISFDQLLDNDEGTEIAVFDFPDSSPDHGILNIGTTSVTYTPDNGYSGVDTFQYRIQDDFGQLSDPATVRVFIGPQAVDDLAYECGGDVIITHAHLLSNDLGDNLSFWRIVDPVNNGTLDTSVPGQIRWIAPSVTQSGNDKALKTDVLAQFSYAAVDNSGQRSNPAWVRIKTLCHGGGDDRKQRYLLLQHILRD